MARLVPLVDIIIDKEIQARFALAEERIALFASLYLEDSEQSDRQLPPVSLIETREGELLLGDGFTRVEAARRAGLDAILAETRPGSMRDAILLSITENSDHGAPLTLAERKRAAERLLADAEWGQRSDRELGRTAGLDGQTIARIRGELAAATVRDQRLVERGGIRYKMRPRAKVVARSSVGNKPDQRRRPVVTTSGPSADIPQMPKRLEADRLTTTLGDILRVFIDRAQTGERLMGCALLAMPPTRKYLFEQLGPALHILREAADIKAKPTRARGRSRTQAVKTAAPSADHGAAPSDAGNGP